MTVLQNYKMGGYLTEIDKFVLKRHVQFCLIALLIARVHRKVRSLSKN